MLQFLFGLFCASFGQIWTNQEEEEDNLPLLDLSALPQVKACIQKNFALSKKIGTLPFKKLPSEFPLPMHGDLTDLNGIWHREGRDD